MTSIGWSMQAVRAGDNARAFTPQVAGSFSFDLSRDIPKTITGLIVPPDEWASVDVRRDQILVILTVDATSYPMGYYAFSELTRQKNVATDSSGLSADVINTALSDRCMLLNRSSGRGETIPGGFDASNEMRRILSDTGISGTAIPYSIAAAPNTSINAVTWDGDTTDLTKLRQLETLAGHRPLWMDNNGVIRSVASQVIDTEIITLSSLQPVAGSISITEKFLTAPNRVIVTDNSAPDYAITGQWDAPASAPHSAANRGYVLTHTESIQGLGSGEHAQDVAATLGESYTARSLSATIVPTPVLDGPQVLSYDGSLWLLSTWEVSLTAGSTMSITAQELIS